MNNRNIVFSASMGSFLEYYDFVIYGMMATYLKSVFFPSHTEHIATVQLFLIFAVGYIARPVGGILSGILGDRYGRKPVFLFLTMLMSISTLLVGLLPTYSQIGSFATCLLVLCRFCQGLSLGGELPGAATLTAESVSPQKRGSRLSVVIASTSVGALMASFTLFCLTTFLDDDSVIDWGWRIPFIIGGLLGAVLFWIRKNMPESPLFQSKMNAGFRKYRTHLVAGWMLTLFWSALVIINLFFPYYIHEYYHYPEKTIYLASTISLIFSAFIIPLCGLLADKLRHLSVLKWVTITYAILSPFLFHMLSYQNVFLLFLFMIIHQLFIALFCTNYTPMMMELFPTRIRYTGMAICYNMSIAIMSSLPTVLTPTPQLVPMVLSGVALISLMAVIAIPRLNTTHKIPHLGVAELS